MMSVAVWILLVSVSPHAKSASARPLFEIVIGTATPTVKLGSTPELTITMTNNSAHALEDNASWMDQTGVDPWWQIDVRDSADRTVPRRVYRFPTGKPVNRTVAPRGSITDHIDLSRLFDFRKPGKYRVKVSREIPKENGGGIANSNVITITVMQAGPPGRARPAEVPTSGKGL